MVRDYDRELRARRTPHTHALGEPPPAPRLAWLPATEALDAAADYVLALDAWQPSGAWTQADKRRLMDEAEADYELLFDRLAGWPQVLVTPNLEQALDEGNAYSASFVVGCCRAYGITNPDTVFAHVQSVRPDACRSKWDALVFQAEAAE